MRKLTTVNQSEVLKNNIKPVIKRVKCIPKVLVAKYKHINAPLSLQVANISLKKEKKRAKFFMGEVIQISEAEYSN